MQKLLPRIKALEALAKVSALVIEKTAESARELLVIELVEPLLEVHVLAGLLQDLMEEQWALLGVFLMNQDA